MHQSDLDRRDALVREEEDSLRCALSELLGSVPEYKPRVLKAPTPKDVGRTLNKRKRAKAAGEQWYESPEERLAVRASKLKHQQDSRKLSGSAFSITASIVNHHINQHRKQCGVMISRDLLEDLVLAELRVLDVYGYEEWIPGDRPKNRAIVWDEVIDGAIRKNLPDVRRMSPAQAVRLMEEIDRRIEEEAAEAKRHGEKSLEVRRAKKSRRMERYVKYLEKHPNATVQMAASDLKLSRSSIESYRRELGLTQPRGIS
ncbi:MULTISPECIES: hypothetical protein [unclassified Leucobacter]|uniref:hypothetical protein n=1 Tax=unclassified Leucobacter TaxID=2621730 RepID=UPI00301725B6